MSMVHVLISPDPAFEEMWREAYGGAVDVYRFATLADGMQRLTSAQSPLDLLVIERSSYESFGLTVSQCVHRLLQPPLANSRVLSRMNIVVIGGRPGRRHDRVRVVSSRDAAVRLVKFGEVERPVQREAQVLPPVSGSPRRGLTQTSKDGVSEYASSVISRIWDAADRSEQPAQPTDAPAAHQPPAQPVVVAPEPGRIVRTPRGTRKLRAGGPAAGQLAGQQRGGVLFVHEEPRVTGGHVPEHPSAPDAETFYQPGQPLPAEMGGLQPARPFQQRVDTQFRGSGLRGSYYAEVVSDEPGAAAMHHAHVHASVPTQQVVAAPAVHQPPVSAAAPMPPALAHQVGSMLYGSNHADPVLSFSRGGQSAVPQMPSHQLPAHHMPSHQLATESLQPPMQQARGAGAAPAPQQVASESGRGGMLARIRGRIAAGERAPTRPTPEAIARAMQSRSDVGASPIPGPANTFDAAGSLLARADVDSAASFG